MPIDQTKQGSQLTAIKAKAKPTKPKMPAMPKSIPADMRGDYQNLIKALIQAETWKPELMPVVESYMASLRMLRTAQATLEAEGRYFINAEGAPRPHPAGADISKAIAALNPMARLLGLSVDAAKMKAPPKPDEAKQPSKGKWSA